MLGLPFLTGVRELRLDGDLVHARCEHDDTFVTAEVRLPALLSTAERLIEPCKVEPAGRAAVPASRLSTLAATDLAGGPWGQAGSPTWVGEVTVVAHRRLGRVLEGTVEEQAREAVAMLVARDAFVTEPDVLPPPVPPSRGVVGAAVGVVMEPGRPHDSRELLGAAARLAARIGGHAAAVRAHDDDDARLARHGADVVVVLSGASVEEDVARGVSEWAEATAPWAILAPSTAWGREVAGRVAATLGAGLTGDAVDLEEYEGRLIAWKPAFGGQLIAAIRALSDTQMATVRVGMLPALEPRASAPPPEIVTVTVAPRSRVRILGRERDDDLDVLAEARAVVGVGRGVDPADYPQLDGLLGALGAELGATRKVTDYGWLPRARQIGITGRSIAPVLFVSIGASGKFNHMVGVRAAGTVLAINPDPTAPVFAASDIGIVAEWKDAVPALVAAIEAEPAARPTARR
jgi:electron transfer flavoprotein alpha subunit